MLGFPQIRLLLSAPFFHLLLPLLESPTKSNFFLNHFKRLRLSSHLLRATVQMPRSRGRSRAPRLSRMDAAVDAMLPYGFPEKRVKQRVKELLKEYGGDEGWPFIEDSSYSVLVESLLDEKDEQVTQSGDLLEVTPCGGNLDEIPPDTCTNPVSTAGQIKNGEAADGAQLPTPSVDCIDKVVPAEKRGARVPCYGWIDSDEGEEDDEFIVLKPMVMAGGVTTWKKKRRSRWDVKPAPAHRS